jgi:hypothetical protein
VWVLNEVISADRFKFQFESVVTTGEQRQFSSVFAKVWVGWADCHKSVTCLRRPQAAAVCLTGVLSVPGLWRVPQGTSHCRPGFITITHPNWSVADRYIASLYYEASMIWVISEWWIQRDLVASGRGLILKKYLWIRLEGLRKTTKTSLSIASRRCWDLKAVRPE